MVDGGSRVMAERLARQKEQRVGLVTALLAGAAVVLLVVIAFLKGAPEGLAKSSHTDWVDSLLSMGLLLVALQFVALLLVHEHWLATARSGLRIVGQLVLALFRLVVTALVLASVWWALPGDTLTGPLDRDIAWWSAATILLCAEIGAVLATAVQSAVVLWNQNDAAPDASAHPVARSTGAGAKDRLAAVGASGGGIRAAAFVLGGHQALQHEAPELGIDSAHEPHVFAVSGGSYIASALALRRAFKPDGTPWTPRAAWAQSYTAESAELQWLRRHTRYLFEPGSRLRDGIVTLLIGAALNIFLVSVGLRFLVWLSAQLAVMLDLMSIDRQAKASKLIGEGHITGLGFHVKDVKSELLGVPVACLALVGVLTLVTWYAASLFDGTDPSRHEWASRWLQRAAVLKPALLLVAIGWIVMTFVLPGATAGVAKVATSNEPSARVASALTGLGLVDENICRQALLTNLRQAETEALQLAAVNPGTAQTVKGGACGSELAITRTLEPGQETIPTKLADTGDRVDSTTLKAINDYVNTTGRSTRTRAAGIAVLLTLIAGLLRRGSSSLAPVTGRLAGIRRWALTWLPLTLMFVLACYLALLWSSGMYSHVDDPGDGHYLEILAILTASASMVAFVVDANVTSMHRYYRTSLSQAFAVGVDGAGTAGQLRPEKVYRFSELEHAGAGPQLHVVATLNTQQPGEAPTLRLGYPIVFGPQQVSVFGHRDPSAQDVPVGDYERFAGPGRVSIMATVGISGAAVSPIMGRYHEQMAPYRMLLALFNLRLGTWTRNPAHTPPGGDDDVHGGTGVLRWLWMTTKPGLVQMALEAAGKSSAEQRWVYLSDGGHLDNTALVECVRHTGPAGRVLILDASNDPVDSWAAIGDAIAVVKADLDIDLVQRPLSASEPGPHQLTWARRYRSGDLDVLVVKAARVQPPKPGEKAEDQDPDAKGLWVLLPPNVQSFLRGHPDFPRASTARQRFGDLEFEAYRAFGHVATVTAMQQAGWVER